MNLWVVRVYKNHINDKIEAVKLVDIDTLRVMKISGNGLKESIKACQNTMESMFNNIYVNKSGAVTMKNLNPDKRKVFFDMRCEGCYDVYRYAIVINANYNVLNVIADDELDGVKVLQNATFGTIRNALKLDSTQKINFYNAIVRYSNDGVIATVEQFNDNKYTEIARVNLKEKIRISKEKIRGIFGTDVRVHLENITADGIFVKDIEYIGNNKGKYEVQYSIPEGVISLDNWLGGCGAIVTPNSLKFLGEMCFYEDENLRFITLNNYLEEIPKCCFQGSSLEEVRFGCGLRRIDDEAFDCCGNLCGDIVTDAKEIGRKAFYDTSIKRLSLLDIRFIEAKAFANNNKLESVKINGNIEEIGNSAFCNCSSLKEIKIPKSVKRIYSGAFAGCNKLKVVELPSGVRLGKQAFSIMTKVIITKG